MLLMRCSKTTYGTHRMSWTFDVADYDVESMRHLIQRYTRIAHNTLTRRTTFQMDEYPIPRYCSFLAACKTQPFDMLPRQIWADYLDERGHTELASYIRNGAAGCLTGADESALYLWLNGWLAAWHNTPLSVLGWRNGLPEILDLDKWGDDRTKMYLFRECRYGGVGSWHRSRICNRFIKSFRSFRSMPPRSCSTHIATRFWSQLNSVILYVITTHCCSEKQMPIGRYRFIRIGCIRSLCR
jgi:uncharacterized protein (TIGR02996 family)